MVNKMMLWTVIAVCGVGATVITVHHHKTVIVQSSEVVIKPEPVQQRSSFAEMANTPVPRSSLRHRD